MKCPECGETENIATERKLDGDDSKCLTCNHSSSSKDFHELVPTIEGVHFEYDRKNRTFKFLESGNYIFKNGWFYISKE